MAIMPVSAARCCGSAPMTRIVSAAALSRMSYTGALFWSAMAAMGAGTVKTT
jgi:hypothetical protein